MAKSIKMTAFLVVAPCSLLEVGQVSEVLAASVMTALIALMLDVVAAGLD
jgi:hypothetical protein